MLGGLAAATVRAAAVAGAAVLAGASAAAIASVGATAGASASASAGPLAAASAGVEAIGCGSQSQAGFVHTFASPTSVVVGPLAFVALRDMRTVTKENIAAHGGFKSPVLVRPGHRVTVSIDPPARSFARLRYSHHGERPFARLPHTIRLVACDRARAGSDVDGSPVTFWSGFFELRRAPACVPVTVTVDHRAPRHLRLSVAHGACG
jgi:hypothetical protein